MLTITCDDNTAALIVVDEVTEIIISHDDWVSSGCPGSGDTIAFDARGTGTEFADELISMRYLVTDEFEHDGDHLLSFMPVDVAGSEDPAADGETMFEPDMEEVAEYAELYGDDALYGDDDVEGLDTRDLSSIPGIKRPPHYMPSLALIAVLVSRHGMTLKEIVQGVIELENASGHSLNDEVVLDWFSSESDSDAKPVDTDVVVETPDDEGDDDIIHIGETSGLPKMPMGDTSQIMV